jgi:DNA end-binding protein Ku
LQCVEANRVPRPGNALAHSAHVPRSIWKGSIAFGLVQIPVDLHVAESPDELSFRQLDKHDFAPIGYERVNKRTGKKVAWEDIVRGFERSRGEFVVLSDRELESANVEATHTIDIVAFVDEGDVDPLYFEKPYYLKPTKQGAKAYALLRHTLEKNAQIGIAKIVIRTRQHLAAIVPRGRALVLVTMRFAHELRSDDELELPSDAMKITEAEQRVASTLVEAMHAKWKPDDYRDDFRDDVLALVEKKAAAGEINTVEELAPEHHAMPAATNVLDLVELLKKSVNQRETIKRRSTSSRGARPSS